MVTATRVLGGFPKHSFPRRLLFGFAAAEEFPQRVFDLRGRILRLRLRGRLSLSTFVVL